MGADAKIDLEKVDHSIYLFFLVPVHLHIGFCFSVTIQNIIEINRPALPVYQTVIEKTRGLAIRTQALGAAISRSGQPPAQQQVSAN